MLFYFKRACMSPTWTKSKCTIFMIVVQNMVYAPYLAECPTESNLPSPVHSTSFSCLILLTRLPRYVSQLWRITGKRNNLWCLKKVRAEWTFYPRWRNTNNNWCTDAPAINTEELSKIFPMGYLPRIGEGWDLQINESLHLEQFCSTVTRIPVCFMVAECPLSLHLKQKRVNNWSSIL